MKFLIIIFAIYGFINFIYSILLFINNKIDEKNENKIINWFTSEDGVKQTINLIKKMPLNNKYTLNNTDSKKIIDELNDKANSLIKQYIDTKKYKIHLNNILNDDFFKESLDIKDEKNITLKQISDIYLYNVKKFLIETNSDKINFKKIKKNMRNEIENYMKIDNNIKNEINKNGVKNNE